MSKRRMYEHPADRLIRRIEEDPEPLIKLIMEKQQKEQELIDTFTLLTEEGMPKFIKEMKKAIAYNVSDEWRATHPCQSADTPTDKVKMIFTGIQQNKYRVSQLPAGASKEFRDAYGIGIRDYNGVSVVASCGQGGMCDLYYQGELLITI